MNNHLKCLLALIFCIITLILGVAIGSVYIPPVDIASAIFRAVLPDFYEDGRILPLAVLFDEEEQVWIVSTQLPRNLQGSNAQVILRKSNVEIVAIWAG